MRRLAKGLPELATELRRRQVGGCGQVSHRQRFEVPGIGEVFGSKKMAG
jgi:hypothetical protein